MSEYSVIRTSTSVENTLVYFFNAAIVSTNQQRAINGVFAVDRNTRVSSPFDREREITGLALLDREFDPQHRQRLQQPRIDQRACVDGFETQLRDQADDKRLMLQIVTGEEHHRFAGI